MSHSSCYYPNVFQIRDKQPGTVALRRTANLQPSVRPETSLITDAHITESAWLLYEAIITLDSEVENFWKPKFTGASILYLMNRYTAVAYCVLLWASYLPEIGDKVRIGTINPVIA